MFEFIVVLLNGCISYEDLGLWDDKYVVLLKKIVDVVYKYGVKIGV